VKLGGAWAAVPPGVPERHETQHGTPRPASARLAIPPSSRPPALSRLMREPLQSGAPASAASLIGLGLLLGDPIRCSASPAAVTLPARGELWRNRASALLRRLSRGQAGASRSVTLSACGDACQLWSETGKQVLRRD
jgi:hypothetical protein